MPNTTNFNFPTPADTDLVKDGASAIRSLGNSIDTAFVDLKGGTTGQVLSKNSNTDMDFVWVAQDDSNAIQNAIVDAKGDLITATAADTPARLAVGTNGQVLTADSTTATGLKWGTASAVGAPEYPTIAFNSYTHSGGTTQVASQAATEDVTYYTAIWLPTCTVDRLSILSGSSWAGTSATVRLGLYNNGSSNLPTTVLLDAGTVTVTAAATTYEITVSQSVTAGLYWFAFNNQTNTSVTVNTYQGTSGVNRFFISRGTVAGSNYTGFEESGITGAFATAGTLSARSSATPTGYARLA